MQREKVLIGLVLSILVLFTMSCSLSNIISEVAGKTESTTKDVNLSRSEFGGFEYQEPVGYEKTDSIGIIQFLAPGAKTETGPAILLMGGVNNEALTNEDLVNRMKETTPDGAFSTPKKIKVDGVSGLDINISSVFEGEEIEGRMIVVMVEPLQQFLMVGVAPKGEWKNTNKDFDKVLKSIKFFKANPEAFTENYVVEPTLEMASEITQEASESNSDGYLHQWASSAVASSEYGSQSWTALQAVGEPDVETCGDNGMAWASASANSVEWIELTYDTPVIPHEITIVQSYNPSQVVDVTGITETGKEYLIWEGTPEYIDTCPDWMTITIEPDNDFYIQKLRITVDQSSLGSGWDEIDAVEMVGLP